MCYIRIVSQGRDGHKAYLLQNVYQEVVPLLRYRSLQDIDVKKRFYVFFILVTFLRFLAFNFFFVFYICCKRLLEFSVPKSIIKHFSGV